MVNARFSIFVYIANACYSIYLDRACPQPVGDGGPDGEAVADDRPAVPADDDRAAAAAGVRAWAA